MRIALGRLGWSESQFYGSTFRAFLIALQGRDAADKYKANELNYLIRNQTFWIVISQLGTKEIKSPTSLWAHDWDKEETPEEAKAVTKETIERLRERFRQRDEAEARMNGEDSGLKH